MTDTIIENIFKYVMFILGTFLLGLSYNLLLAPNNLVIGGMSGIGLILQELLGWNSEAFIYISSFILLIVSFIFIGGEDSKRAVVGSILYPVMVTLTMPLAQYFLKYSDVSEFLIIVSLAGLLNGASNGIIYKMGFNTGGGDIIMQLIAKYANISNSKAAVIYNSIILIACGFVFGISSFIYSVIIMVVSTIIIDKIDVGTPSNKTLTIYTTKGKKVQAYLKEKGYLPVELVSKIRIKVIFVLVSEKMYVKVKNEVLNIDKDAIILINDSYEELTPMFKTI